jgi:hypothetical protein
MCKGCNCTSRRVAPRNVRGTGGTHAGSSGLDRKFGWRPRCWRWVKRCGVGGVQAAAGRARASRGAGCRPPAAAPAAQSPDGRGSGNGKAAGQSPSNLVNRLIKPALGTSLTLAGVGRSVVGTAPGQPPQHLRPTGGARPTGQDGCTSGNHAPNAAQCATYAHAQRLPLPLSAGAARLATHTHAGGFGWSKERGSRRDAALPSAPPAHTMTMERAPQCVLILHARRAIGTHEDSMGRSRGAVQGHSPCNLKKSRGAWVKHPGQLQQQCHGWQKQQQRQGQPSEQQAGASANTHKCDTQGPPASLRTGTR